MSAVRRGVRSTSSFLPTFCPNGARGHNRARAMPDRDQALALKLAVCRRDGVQIDTKIRSDLPHGRQRCALGQLAAGNERLDRINNLLVDRPPVIWIDRDQHPRPIFTSSVQCIYTLDSCACQEHVIEIVLTAARADRGDQRRPAKWNRRNVYVGQAF